MCESYYIKQGYVQREVNVTREPAPATYWHCVRRHTSRYFQDSVYQYAADLALRNGLDNVLDVGCGVGHKLVRHLHPVVGTAVGLDQETCLRFARKLHPQVRFVATDLEQSRPPNLGSFDLIVSVDVIEHLADPDALLGVIRQHTHVGSWVVLSTPERDVLRGEGNLKSPKREHLREWNRPELAAYLASRGFDVVEHCLVPAYHCGLSPVMWMFRVVSLLRGVPRVHSQMAVCKRTRLGGSSAPESR